MPPRPRPPASSSTSCAAAARDGTLRHFTGGDKITNSELLQLSCGLLVPCALQNQITAEIAPKVNARYIIEGANGPTTPAAEDILEDQGVCVLPDIVANVGGAVVAYFELVQDLYHYYWPVDEVFAKQKAIMQRSTEEVYAVSSRNKIRLRHSAWMSALGKVITAMKLRGWVRG